MSKPEKYKHINFTPPSGVRREAEYGLKLRREHGRGGTAVGIARARDLSNGVELSPSTVRRMKAFFDRHASDENAEGFRQGEPGFPSNGKIANLLWGGPSGYSFAKKVVAQMEAADAKAEGRDLRPYGSSHGIHPRVIVVHGAPCSGKADYVWKHKGDNDVVFDFNRIMESLSGSNKSRDDLVSYCLDIRTLILKKALRGKDSPKTWIITTKVGDDLKGQLSDVPVKYVHIEAPKEECLARLEKERHPDDVEELRKVIEDYFSTEQEQRFAPAAPNVERRFLGNFSQAEKADPNLLRVERRSDPQDGKPRTYIVGYAATFGRDSLLLGDFVERIEPSAFDIVAKREDGEGKPLETRCLFNHSPDHLLGRFPTTMRMTVDEKGLKYECLLPESRSDLAELIERGDLKGSSFSFVIADGGERWTVEDGRSIRVVTAIKSLLDCGPVTYPAYGDASVSVAKRSYEQFVQEKIRKPSRLPEVKAKAAAVSAEIRQFLESRNCGTGSGGFQKGNSCGGAGGGPTASKKEDSNWREGGAAGALVGGAIGGIAGLPAAAAGAVAGAVIGAIGGMYGNKGTKPIDTAMENVRVSEKKLDKAAKSLGESMTITGDGKTVDVRGPSVDFSLSKNVPSDLGHGEDAAENEKVHADFRIKPTSNATPKGVIAASKAVKADYVTVQVSAPAQKELFKAAGFKEQGGSLVYGNSYDPEKAFRRSYDELTAFLAERRDCGRDESGKFGSGNECQNDATTTTGEKSKYMEWKKGDHLKEDKPEKTQEFLDDAREGQLARGGKDGGKSDDGGGVQTWSKGDDYPWTTQQVGTDEGYLQARHPDGSKTEKYPFSKGDTSAASEALKNELKKKKKSRASDVAEETLRFLRERTRM
jgi:HK97 family phage prohead protease